MPNAMIKLCYKEGIKSLFEIPVEHKVFKAYHILGDREVPVYFLMLPNNFLIGTIQDWTRIYVGKLGEKDDLNKAKLALFYMDLAPLYPYLGSDFKKVEFFETTNYLEDLHFRDKESRPIFFSARGRNWNDMCLPESNGTLYSEIEDTDDAYVRNTITSYLYAQVQESLVKDSRFYIILKTIEQCCNESNKFWETNELSRVYQKINEELMSRPYYLELRRK